MSLQRKLGTDSLPNPYKQTFFFPQAKPGPVTFPSGSTKDNLRCPFLAQSLMIHFYPAFDLWRASSLQSGFFSLWGWAVSASLCFERCIGASHSGTGTSCLPIPYNCKEWIERHHPSWKPLQSPFCGRRLTTRLPMHTHTSSTIQPQPPCHQHGRPRWQIDAAAGFFSFFSFSLPPPTKPFFLALA